MSSLSNRRPTGNAEGQLLNKGAVLSSRATEAVPEAGSAESSESSQVQTPRVVTLGRGYMEEVVALEQRSYPCPWSPDLVRGEFYKDISFRLGLEVDGHIAAYAFTYLIPEDLHLLNIAVAPGHRSKGYGRFLLCNVLSRAINCGARLATLEVRPSNAPARALYYSLGFRQNGMRRNYYRDNGEDALLLERPMGPLDLPFFERNSRTSLKS